MGIREILKNFFFGHTEKASGTPALVSPEVSKPKSVKPKKVVKKSQQKAPKTKQIKPKIIETEIAPKEEVNTLVYTVGAGKGKKPVDPKKKDVKVKLGNPKQ